MRIVKGSEPGERLPPALEIYSPRERAIIAELAQGFIVKDIADHLELAHNTIKDYLKAIYVKARVHTAGELLVQLHSRQAFQPAHDRRHLALIAAFDEVLAAVHAEAVVTALLDATRACCQATRAGVWRSAHVRGRMALIPLGPGAVRFPGPAAFLDHVTRDGCALRTPGPRSLADAWDRPEDNELASLGMDACVFGVQLQLPRHAGMRVRLNMSAGPTVLLMSKPHPFTPAEASTCRMLARLAEIQCGSFAYAAFSA